MVNLTNIDPFGMVDVTEKDSVPRTAEAVGRIILREKTIKAIMGGKIKKGNPLGVAEVACIQAVKGTPYLLPMCHQIPLTSVNAEFTVGEDNVEVRCRVSATYKTGVEMEALTGVSIALINIWDMVKYLEKDEEGQYPTTMITGVRVVEKKKGEK